VTVQEPNSLPEAADVVAAYATARQWLNDFDLRTVESPDSQVSVRGASAVLVMLRSAGRVAGVGMDWTADDRMLRRALGRAFGDLLGDAALARVAPEQRDEIGRRITLELETAGALTPLIAASWDDVGRQIRPGLDGVALRRGDDWVFRFPAHLRSMNATAVAAVLPGLLPDLEIAARDRTLAQLRDEVGLSVYRFSTIHLAQAAPAGAPFTTFRGSRVVAAADVTASSLSNYCGELIRHLGAHRWERRGVDGEVIGDEPLGMFGSYEPVAGRFEMPVAPPFEQALVSYALSHFARTPGVDQEDLQAAASFAEEILLELADVVPDMESDPNDDPAASAMIILAINELIQNPGPAIRDLDAGAKARLRKAFDHQGGGFVPVEGLGGEIVALPSQARALVACAMARLLARGEAAPGGATAVRAALDSAWMSAETAEQVGLLPWIGWAELEYSTAATGGMPVEVQARLDAFREMLWRSQLGFAADEEPDLVGGFALAGPTGTQVTSQGLRPGAWLARRLAVDAGGAERGVEIGRLLLFARFLMQLAVTEDERWFYQNGRLAVGGVSEAPWDYSQPLAAQALALLTVSDILRAVRAETGG
jgi:hypothetical protein